MIFATLFVAVVYTIAGSWKWGGGFLDGMGFYDFAGSTLVHSVGGWGALAGVLLLGPRLGKYVAAACTPSPAATCRWPTMGVFLLWLGWFGFNGGSVLSADPALTSFVLVTTCLAASAGAVVAIATSWFAFGKPDLSMALNGVLAGLVGITAGADTVGIDLCRDHRRRGRRAGGGLGDVLRPRQDRRPGGRHLGPPHLRHLGHPGGRDLLDQPGAQLPRCSSSVLLLRRLHLRLGARPLRRSSRLTMGIRVSEEEELEGLDLGEHGMHAYDLGAGPGWREQPPGVATQSLRAAPPKLATSETGC